MNEQDLLKTKKVYSLDELNSMTMNALGELSNAEEPNDLEPKLETPPVTKKKNFFKKLSKKGKIIFISIIVGFIIFASLFIYFFFFKKSEDKKPTDNNLIIDKENYRYENGELVFLDNDTEIGRYKCKNKNVNLCFLANYSNEDDDFFTSRQVYESLEPIINGSDFINNQYAFIIDKKNDGEDLINIYDFINEFSVATVKAVKYYGIDNYVIIKDKNDLYGLYDLSTTGFNEKIDCLYNYLGIITEEKDNDNILVATSNGFHSLITYDNKDVTKNYEGPIKNYNSEYVVVGSNNKYFLYDYKKNLVFDKSFSYIKLLDEYVLCVDELNLYIYDYEGFKYNSEPIILPSSQFNKLFIYDEEGKSKGVNGSFDVTINENLMKITLLAGDKSVKSINLLEGMVSKKIKYINYFDNTLYFYGDEEKTSLLGSYKCTNKNILENADSSLNNCFIARDTIYETNDMTNNSNEAIGLIPIINGTFVFIKDNSNASGSETVKLYNLKTSKALGTYQNVCTYTFTGLEEVSFVTNNIQVIARNKDGKMGMIKLDKEEVSSSILFNYLSLEKMGKYYLAKNAAAKYLLIFNDSATSVSPEFTGKIVGYNDLYIKVIENNKYSIYDYQGNKTSKIAFKYIDLLSTIYLGIDDSNELKVYNYNNEQIISDGIMLNSTKYKDATNPAYKVNLEGNILQISVLKDGIYGDNYFDIVTGMKVEG